MVHPCAACHLRFTTTGELRDHVTSDHTEQPAATSSARAVRRRSLTVEDYSRSGWARPQLLSPRTAARQA